MELVREACAILGRSSTKKPEEKEAWMGKGERMLGFRVIAENPSRAWTRQQEMNEETKASGKLIALRLFILEEDESEDNKPLGFPLEKEKEKEKENTLRGVWERQKDERLPCLPSLYVATS